MNRKQVLIGAGALAGIASLALAHHVPMGLSHVSGSEVLNKVTFFTQASNFGIPAYQVGAAEVPGHHDPVGLAHGDAFTVMNQAGQSETIVLEATDFADITQAVMHDVMDVVNAKSTLFEAIEANGYLVLEGHTGGPSGSLTIQDGNGAPLGKMGMVDSFAVGSDNLTLTLSIPDPNLNLAGKPYLVLASTTPGSFRIQGKTVPLAQDTVFNVFLNAVMAGAVPGFKGVLDANSDAVATLSANQFQAGFAGNFPDKMYFAYLVFDPARRVAYVSNAFTVDFQ